MDEAIFLVFYLDLGSQQERHVGCPEFDLQQEGDYLEVGLEGLKVLDLELEGGLEV